MQAAGGGSNGYNNVDKDPCAIQERLLLNNNVCDDIANTKECRFDGGDCCMENRDEIYCLNCDCIKEGESRGEVL